MLRIVDNDLPDDLAYRVPFTVDRSRAPWYELHNRSAERVRGVSLSMLGSGRLLWGLPTALEANDYLRFAVHGDDIARDSVLLVRWFRPTDEEYLWRVSF